MKFTRSEIARDVATGGGEASIQALHPGAEVRALSPAIEAAYAEFEAQNAAAAPIRAERKRLVDELNELRESKNPALEYDEDRDAELAREIAKADNRLRANEVRAKRLAIDYLVAVGDNPDKDKAREHAAALALKAHEDAVAALAALEDALGRREVFYTTAGRPAEWKHFKRAHNYMFTSGATRAAHENIAKEVAAFPAADVKTVANGGEVMTLAELQFAQKKAAAEAEAEAIAETRERNRRESIIERNS